MSVHIFIVIFALHSRLLVTIHKEGEISKFVEKVSSVSFTKNACYFLFLPDFFPKDC